MNDWIRLNWIDSALIEHQLRSNDYVWIYGNIVRAMLGVSFGRPWSGFWKTMIGVFGRPWLGFWKTMIEVLEYPDRDDSISRGIHPKTCPLANSTTHKNHTIARRRFSFIEILYYYIWFNKFNKENQTMNKLLVILFLMQLNVQKTLFHSFKEAGDLCKQS